jgi:branched-chain amino acid transport system substrate-binding protein
MLGNRLPQLAAALLAASSAAIPANAAGRSYGPGVTDNEIKIGNIVPYSGPASAYGIIGRTAEAFFRKLNDEAAIDGRKITFISYDDALARRRRSSRQGSSLKAKRCS